jgi:hypothetical protein
VFDIDRFSPFMSKPSILILDDDEMWLARHERRLTQAGFKCFATQNAKQAIDWGKSETSIKFGLVDEILFVPPVPINESQRELQRWQGSGAIREIAAMRHDIQFIIVTSAPQLHSQENDRLFSRETSKLRRQPQVVDLIHKQDIEIDPDAEYHWLIGEILDRSQHNIIGRTPDIKPRVLLGIGLDPAIYESIAEALDRQRTSHLLLTPYLKKLPEHQSKPTIEKLISSAIEQCIFVEAPGSKKLDRTSIKPNSQSGQILSILATRSELQQNAIVREADYQYNPRSKDRPYDIDSTQDSQTIVDFAYEYSDGRKHRRDGVQIETRQTESRLKTAIHRLKQNLAKANVAPLDTLFNFNGEGYIPNFELGIVVYSVKPKRKRIVG